MPVLRGGKKSLVNDDKKRAGGKPRNTRKSGGKRKLGRGAIYSAAAGQLSKDVRWLMSVVNVEDKYLDTTAVTVTSNTWQYILVNGLLQGTTPNTRIGQSVKCVGIECRYNIFCNSVSTAFQTVRFVIFIDKNPNAAVPGTTDVYGSGCLLPRTVGYMDRFTVLHERRIAFSPVGSDGIYTLDYIDRQNWHQEFNLGNAGTIADIDINSLYVAFITDQGANQPTVAFTIRYVYVDN
jgi:hypothetical protein